MSEGDIERIMKLAFCSEEDARKSYAQTHDVIDAVDLLLSVPPSRGNPHQKIVSEEQQKFMEIRKTMESIETNITDGFKKSDQPAPSSPKLLHSHDHVPEEMTLRSDCIQSSQIPTQESVVQTPETACQ
jgi:hypothetical protein